MQDKNIISVFENGPIHIRGDLVLINSDGDVIQKTDELYLCRCGNSNNKPYCDGEHKKKNFLEAGKFIKPPASETDVISEGVLEIKVQPNGPLIFRGVALIRDCGDEEIYRKVGGLCRCGQSNNSPFCDGTHSKIEFVG